MKNKKLNEVESPGNKFDPHIKSITQNGRKFRKFCHEMAVAGRVLQVIADYGYFNIQNASMHSFRGREEQVVADHRGCP
jgi:hypothetical protein